MRPGTKGICTLTAVMLLGMAISNATWAGDFKEAKQRADQTGAKLETPGATIFHRVWPSNAFPLKWRLHKDGLVNNSATGGKQLRSISNEEVRRALEAAFQQWADLESASISVEYAGETDTAKAACDLENIVTWSDESSFSQVDDRRIARGLTSFYAGPDIVLDDTNRKNVPCSAGESRNGSVEIVPLLPKDKFPNGMTLKTGTILDADLVLNSRVFDFFTTLSSEQKTDVLDLQAIAAHEFGHMLGLTHTSLKTGGDIHGRHTPTMAVVPVPPSGTGNPDRRLQQNIRSLHPDDIAAASRAYPGPEFSDTTGELKGKVTMNGNGVEGVRVWLYDANGGIVGISDDGVAEYDIEWQFSPLYEIFTATSNDNELMSGEFSFKGIPAGRYFVCVMPWNNNIPNKEWAVPSEGTYNWSVKGQSGANTASFKTECFENVHHSGRGWPEIFDNVERTKAVNVLSGETTANVNISVEPHSQ